MSQLSHSRRFDPRPFTSDIPRQADVEVTAGMSQMCQKRKLLDQASRVRNPASHMRAQFTPINAQETVPAAYRRRNREGIGREGNFRGL
jgi:hypothetical protein